MHGDVCVFVWFFTMTLFEGVQNDGYYIGSYIYNIL